MPQMKLTKHCRICKKGIELSVDVDGFRQWIRGALIQNALPDNTSDERELLVSGTCGTCFTRMFEECDK